MNTKDIYSAVDRHYADAARSNDREYSTRVAKQFGYSAGELESIPQDANLGLSCGNPHALANLKEVSNGLQSKLRPRREKGHRTD